MELAEKYDIDISNIKQMNYEDWKAYLEKVYDGEKKEGTKNLKMIVLNELPFEENNTFGYIDKMNGLNYIVTAAFGINENKIENFYADDKIKQCYKTYAEYYKKGYFKYMNPTSNDEDSIDTGNCFLFLTSVGSEDELKTLYPKVKRLKRIYYETSLMGNYLEDASITGICSASKNKSMAIDAFNTIYTDKKAANLIKYPNYNIENEDFNMSEEDIVVSDYENYAGPSDLLTNPFLSDNYARNKNGTNIIETMDNVTLNDNFAGKVFDYTPVKKQVRKIKKIEEKYIDNADELKGDFLKGNFEETWSDFLYELDKAGIDKVIEYLNKQ